MAQQAVFTVLERGGSIAVDEARYLLGVPAKLKSAKKQLRSMQAFHKDLDDKMLRGGFMARNLVSDVKGVAYEVEDIIDAANILRRRSDPKTSITGAISKYACFPLYLSRLHNLGARIDSATERMKTIFEDFEKHHIAATSVAEEPWVYCNEDEAIQHRRSVHPDFDEQVDVIGFDEQITRIKNDLLDEWNKEMTVVSIIGPGGAGKSTMAKKVYGLASVKGHFKFHAWIIVSQGFVPHDLLRQLVKHAKAVSETEETEKMTAEATTENTAAEETEKMTAQATEKMTEHEMKKFLHDFLQRRRAAFPDEKNGSRIVLTTRNGDVAQHPDARKKLYEPKLLNEEESTRLLFAKALPEYNLVGSSNSPPVAAAMRPNLDELEKLGRDLAVKCRGLPLAIIVLGGYLSKNIDAGAWKRLRSDKFWHDMISTEKVIGAVMDLSYYDMPSHLRSCFMYATAFPEDSSIDVRELTGLWVAEGFIPMVRGHTREEVATKNVAELVQRCMMQVEKRANSGAITVVRLHDILRDWGIGRARREGLMKDCHTEEDAEASYSEEMIEAYRVVLHGFLTKEIAVYMRHLRTLLYFIPNDGYSTVSGDKFSQRLRHLRVLYLHGLGPELYLPNDIVQMRYLRYLGLGGSCLYHLPFSVGDLLNLETLHATGVIHHISSSLWRIPALRQVHVSNARGWSVPRINTKSKMNVTVFCKADWYDPTGYMHDKAKQTMETTKRQISKNKNPNLSCCFGMMYGKDRMHIVGRYKDGLQFPNDDLPCYEKLHDIRELKVCCANLLNNDKKMLELGRMTFLETLEIGEQSYTGAVVTFPHGSFVHLQELVLHDLAMEEWEIESGSMPRLKELTLYKCPNLRYLPEGLSLLPDLVDVHLIAMPPGCQQGTVARGLKEKGCFVFISSDEKDFERFEVWFPHTTY
ncbi:unnamed protein product [Urochloa decumbens]|uniref:NB-ARC domain-containing protein n=1 Tax=Urochloa decumbens TaxID=240449 RepID=A0ABC9DTX0_9POAL